jgi:hypothetical protein
MGKPIKQGKLEGDWNNFETGVVVPNKQQERPRPEHPKFKRQEEKILAFRAGMASARDRLALCPYEPGSLMHREWHRGREFFERVWSRMKQ